MTCSEPFLLRSTHAIAGSFEDCTSDCACPADGLHGVSAVEDPEGSLYQSTRLFLQPLDEEYSVGYTPFALAGRSS